VTGLVRTGPDRSALVGTSASAPWRGPIGPSLPEAATCTGPRAQQSPGWSDVIQSLRRVGGMSLDIHADGVATLALSNKNDDLNDFVLCE
jgi:hypothetical protein